VVSRQASLLASPVVISSVNHFSLDDVFAGMKVQIPLRKRNLDIVGGELLPDGKHDIALGPPASIGSPATPGVGIVILAMVLETVGIPAAGIALIMGVDRILDMSRTAINVTGDLVTCALMEKWVGGGSEGSHGSAEPPRDAAQVVS